MATPWAPGRLQAWVIAGLRSLSRKYPPRFETLKEAATEKKTNVKTGRLAQHYECAECRNDFPATGVNVDHLIPVCDPEKGFEDWNTYIPRLFCEKANLQVLCSDCHSKKSLAEGQVRTAAKRERNCKSNPLSKTKTATTSSKASSRKKKSTS